MSSPDWLTEDKIVTILDARPLLAKGIHPLEEVLQQCSSLQAGEIFGIITPFPPVPMIEKMASIGFKTFSEPGADSVYHTYFKK